MGVIIMLFIGIVVAIALLNPIADTTSQLTTKQTTSNESVNVITAAINDTNVNESINFTIYSQSAWKQLECPLESVTIRNGGAQDDLTANTDYILYADAGVYSLLNTTKTIPEATENGTYVDYTHCADGYNTSAGSRSIANITVIFSALALFAFVLVGIKSEWF